MRRFVVIGRRATASPDFLLRDVAGTSGRLDVLLRCLRAALLVSHGVRRDVMVYLVLLGGPAAPRAVRVDGAAAMYLRPDEVTLGTLLKKTLAAPPCDVPGRFVEGRHGVAVAAGGLEAVLADLRPGTPYLLEEDGRDVRTEPRLSRDAIFFVGDDLGFDASARQRLLAFGANALSVGPVSLHADDAVAVVSNECDRRAAGMTGPAPRP